MISIIVPTYNAGEYLNRCIESLLGQTEQELEVILVDDGSTDQSVAQLAESPLAKDRRLHIIRQPHAGQSAARNRGLKHAKGELIAFVDADDQLMPDWCEQHLQAIEGVDYVQSGCVRVSAHNDGMSVAAPLNDGMMSPKALNDVKQPRNKYQFTSPCMRLYRREAIEGMQFVEGMIYEDVVWSVDLWMRELRCRQIAYAGYLYTRNPKSTTAQRHPEAEQRVFEELKRRAKSQEPRAKQIILYTIIRLKLHFRKQ